MTWDHSDQIDDLDKSPPGDKSFYSIVGNYWQPDSIVKI